MRPTNLTYLSFDSIGDGVGASQVGAYVKHIARRGVDVTLHTFEKDPASTAGPLEPGVSWRPHRFGRVGPFGGLERMTRGALAVRGAQLAHARSDLAAASALLGRPEHWIWDVRSFWADQRIALGALATGSKEERLLRRVEAAAAVRSDGIITLTSAALDTLVERFGTTVGDKSVVIPTCVDLEAFSLSPMPAAPTRLLLSGTLNAFYDVPSMLTLAQHLSRLRPTEVRVLAPGPTRWDAEFQRRDVVIERASASEVAAHVAGAHAGLSMCRLDAGVSLRAAVPTKIAEFLAAGRPVVVNQGLGDMDALLEGAGSGVVVTSSTEIGLRRAAAELDELLRDPQLPERCRALAEREFDLEKGVERLMEMYARVTGDL